LREVSCCDGVTTWRSIFTEFLHGTLFNMGWSVLRVTVAFQIETVPVFDVCSIYCLERSRCSIGHVETELPLYGKDASFVMDERCHAISNMSCKCSHNNHRHRREFLSQFPPADSRVVCPRVAWRSLAPPLISTNHNESHPCTHEAGTRALYFLRVGCCDGVAPVLTTAMGVRSRVLAEQGEKTQENAWSHIPLARATLVLPSGSALHCVQSFVWWDIAGVRSRHTSRPCLVKGVAVVDTNLD
jgi:hypothetical protein